MKSLLAAIAVVFSMLTLHAAADPTVNRSVITLNQTPPVNCWVPTVAAGWTQVRVSNVDFDGDGKSDLLLWQGDPTKARFGDVVVWLMDGCVIHNSALIANVKNPNWALTSFGDFNGDGKTDVVWAFVAPAQ